LESDLAAVYDAMACGVVVRNASGGVVFANAAAKRIFGRPPEELEGAEPPGEDRRIREDGTTMPDDGFLAVSASYPRAVEIARRTSKAQVVTYAPGH